MDFDLTAEAQIATILGTMIAAVSLALLIWWQKNKKKEGGNRQNQNDSINQLIEYLDNRCGITKILLLAHKIAKKRKDQEMLAWLQAEIDGYEEPDEEISYRIIEAHFLMRAGSNEYPLPHIFFLPKSAEEVERIIIQYKSTSTEQRDPLFMHIPTPDEVKDFFESQRSEKPDLQIPKMITLFTKVEQYEAILTGIRKKIRNYVLEIQ